MTNLLVWNIQKFSSTKIRGAAGLPRRQVIQTVFNAANGVQVGGPGGAVSPLDLFAIVEVTSPVCAAIEEGTVLGSLTQSGIGVLSLLGTVLPRWAAAGGGALTGWALVPPIMLGDSARREAVALFYNTATLQFLGPWYAQSVPYPDGTYVLSSVQQPPSPPPNRYQAYGGNSYGNVLPNTRPAPNGATENQLAGQWAYYNAANQRIYFPVGNGQAAGPNGQGQAVYRSPYLTQFLQIATGRVINLFSVHTTPGPPASLGMGSYPAIPSATPGANQVCVFAGDFNVDTFQDSPVLPFEYQAMANMAPPYAIALDPRNAAGVVRLMRQPYCLTELIGTAQATPWLKPVGGTSSPTANVYPRLGYLGGWGGTGAPPTDAGSIDNVLVAPGPVTAATVVNTVVGLPYAPPPPANCANLAVAGFPAMSPMAIPNIVPSGSAGAAAALTNFQLAANFPLIHSVSDHLPVYASF
jgi:hypothetical protein